MLEAIRKHSSSAVVKVLFIILILSFGSGIWMNWDMIGSGLRSDWAVKVGDIEIPKHQLNEEYQRALRRLRAAVSDSIDAEQARNLGLPNRVLTQIVNRALFDLEAAKLGMAVSDQEVRQTIHTDPQFRNPQGQFDAERFRQALGISGLTEEGYVAMVRGEIAREQLVNSMVGSATVSQTIVDAFYRYRQEKRAAEYVRLIDNEMTIRGKPHDNTLREFYAQRTELFTAPEYRALTTIIVRTQDLAAGIKVTEGDLEGAYAERIGEFSEPERRTVQQMLFASEDEARRAHAQLAAGIEFATVAQQSGLDLRALELGTVTHGELLPELADPMFALPHGAISEPIRSPFGWHVVKVENIIPARQRSLEEVKEELTRQITSERAVEALYDMGNRLDDALGRGATLEEAARELNLEPFHIDMIDRQGANPSGEKLPDLSPRFLDTAFSTEEKMESQLTEADVNTYFVLRVDKIIPPTLKPFDSVREEVHRAWRAAEQEKTAQSVAASLAERIRNGASMADVAAEKGLKLVTMPPVTRTAEGISENVPGPLITELFRASQGDPIVVRAQDASYVARVTKVIAADPSSDQADLMTIRRELTSAMQADLLSQMSDALSRRWSVKVNDSIVEQLSE